MQDWRKLPQSYWREKLTKEQFHVTREHGTEPAFSGAYWNHHAEGVYHCICCGTALFDSQQKFDSGTGWPSYFDVIDKSRLELRRDRSWFMVRTEVLCQICGAHLGHVFEDGPEPTGLRYCINSAALNFSQRGKP